jgi:hypothetical protein
MTGNARLGSPDGRQRCRHHPPRRPGPATVADGAGVPRGPALIGRSAVVVRHPGPPGPERGPRRSESDLLTEVPGGPSGLGFTPDGALLVASMRGRRVLRRADGELRVHTDVRPAGWAALNDMVVHPRTGNAYVDAYTADEDAGAVLLVRPDGRFDTAAELAYPNGLVILPGSDPGSRWWPARLAPSCDPRTVRRRRLDGPDRPRRPARRGRAGLIEVTGTAARYRSSRSGRGPHRSRWCRAARWCRSWPSPAPWGWRCGRRRTSRCRRSAGARRVRP